MFFLIVFVTSLSAMVHAMEPTGFLVAYMHDDCARMLQSLEKNPAATQRYIQGLPEDHYRGFLKVISSYGKVFDQTTKALTVGTCLALIGLTGTAVRYDLCEDDDCENFYRNLAIVPCVSGIASMWYSVYRSSRIKNQLLAEIKTLRGISTKPNS